MKKEAELPFETLVPLYKSKRCYILENITFFCVTDKIWGRRLDSSGSGQDPALGSYKKEIFFGSIKYGEFIDQMTAC